jgi:hypothetical protein
VRPGLVLVLAEALCLSVELSPFTEHNHPTLQRSSHWNAIVIVNVDTSCWVIIAAAGAKIAWLGERGSNLWLFEDPYQALSESHFDGILRRLLCLLIHDVSSRVLDAANFDSLLIKDLEPVTPVKIESSNPIEVNTDEPLCDRNYKSAVCVVFS